MNKKINIVKKLNRQSMVEQGFFDGRFKTKVVPNKKEQLAKKKWKYEIDNE